MTRSQIVKWFRLRSGRALFQLTAASEAYPGLSSLGRLTRTRNRPVAGKYLWFGLLVATALHAQGTSSAQWLCPNRPLTEGEILKQVRSGVKDSVITRFVKTCHVAFAPQSPILKHLKEAGASEAIIDAVRRDLRTSNSSPSIPQRQNALDLKKETQSPVDTKKPGQAEARQRPEIERLVSDTERAGYWKDPSTGLLWAAKDNGADKDQGNNTPSMTWIDAGNYCRNLVIGSYSRWRLPNVSELAPMYDPSVTYSYRVLYDASPYHVKGGIKLSGASWSSVDYNQFEAWEVAFFGEFRGRIRASKTRSAVMRALCVYLPGEDAARHEADRLREEYDLLLEETYRQDELRRLQAETARVGYWRDPSSGLTWAATDNGKDVLWSDAVGYCQTLSLGGSADWRLPTIAEFQTVTVPSANVDGVWVWGGVRGGLTSDRSVRQSAILDQVAETGPKSWLGVAWSSTQTDSLVCGVDGCSPNREFPSAKHRALCVRGSLTASDRQKPGMPQDAALPAVVPAPAQQTAQPPTRAVKTKGAKAKSTAHM